MEEQLSELRRQHLDQQQQYAREKEEGRKAYVLPVQWTQVFHKDYSGFGWGSSHLDGQNLRPGPAKNIRVFVYSKHPNMDGYFTGLVPGLVPDGSITLTLGKVQELDAIPAGGINGWGVSLQDKDPNRAIAVHISAQTVLDEEMPPVITIVFWRTTTE